MLTLASKSYEFVNKKAIILNLLFLNDILDYILFIAVKGIAF